MKKHNHFYPAFHIRKWKECGGKIYVKKTKRIRNINPQKDFTLNYYYSLGEHDSALEDRISNFEKYISNVVKKIDQADNVVHLSGKELELLKLYGVLCASRQHFTSEVILDDESCIYKSNNYLFGVHRFTTQEDAVVMTEQIIEDFEKIIKLEDSIVTQINPQVILQEHTYSVFTIGMHIAILRSEINDLCIADRCAIIENTMDSDYLYTYIPISPKTAICLVKSKYYLSLTHFENTKIRFGNKYGGGIPDPFISEIFKGRESLLFCTYYIVQSNAHMKPIYLEQDSANSVFVKIVKIDPKIVWKFNSIFCEDGKIILFCDKDAMDAALHCRLSCRHVMTY